jgi:hypothetical protein
MERNLMRSTASLRLRMIAGAVAAATVVAVGVVSAPPAGAAQTHHLARHELSAGLPPGFRNAPSGFKTVDATVCVDDHPHWCAGANAGEIVKVVRGDIEFLAAVIVLIQVTPKVIKGVLFVRWYFKKWLYHLKKSRHRVNLTGDCLTQEGGNVDWGKCGKGTSNAVATSSLWEADESLSNPGEWVFVNDYWLNKGKDLFFTTPSKIAANGHLRLHALFGGKGEEEQVWEFENIS